MKKSSTSVNKQTFRYLSKERITKEIPCVSFLRTVIVKWEIHANSMNPKKKTFLSCVNEQIYISFGKFSKRINIE